MQYTLAEPEPKVTVASLGDSSVNLAVRPWINAMDYAPASHDLTEAIKKALDEAGISIPVPATGCAHVQPSKSRVRR